MKKYELTEKHIYKSDSIFSSFNQKFYRIVACRDIFDKEGNIIVHKGEKGGYIQSEENLSHEGSCWVAGEACIHGSAVVRDDAFVFGNALVSNSTIEGSARVGGSSKVFRNSKISDNALIDNYANVENSAVSRCAKVSSSAKVFKSFVADNAIIKDNALVSDGSKITGSAQILSRAEVFSSSITDNVLIKYYACVKNSSIFGDAQIKNHASVTSSYIYGKSVIGGSTCLKDCYVNLTSSEKKYPLFSTDCVMFQEHLTDEDIEGAIAIPKRDPFNHRDFSAVVFKCHMQLVFTEELTKALKKENNFIKFSSRTALIHFLTKHFPIGPSLPFLEEEYAIAEYISDNFSREKLEEFSSKFSKNLFDFLIEGLPKKKSVCLSNKEYLLSFLENYFFFLMVKMYLIAATVNETNRRIFADTHVSYSSFVNCSYVDVTNGVIEEFCPDLVYDFRLPVYLGNFLGLSFSEINNLEYSLAKRNSFFCALSQE